MFQIALVRVPYDERDERDSTPWLDSVTEDTDDTYIELLLSDACKTLASSKRFRFIVDGFGDLNWPLDVAFDLRTFVEPLPDLLGWLTSQEEQCLIVFYEQGVDRSLTFTKRENLIFVSCQSWGEWQPTYETEILTSSEFGRLLREFIDQFVTGVEEFAPIIYEYPTFSLWRDELQKRLDDSSNLMN